MGAEIALCLKCSKLYGIAYLALRKGKDRYKCDNCGATVIEVDENIAPTILLLNQKGYKTKFCCVAHLYEGVGYIIFDKKYQFPKLNIEHFYFGEFDEEDDCIRWSFVKYNKENNIENCSIENLNRLQNGIFELNRYVSKLPKISD